MTTGEKIIKKAESYKGKSGGFVWNYWAGLPWGASWCVGFVLYVLYKCGLKKEIYNPSKTSNPFWLPTIEEWLHKHATHVKMADARPGDIVIFTWTGGGNNARKVGKCSRDHIGFIREKGNSSTCWTIEGNTSGGIVAERTRAKTYIFAIYRLDCCKDEAKPVKETTTATTEVMQTLYVPKKGEKCYDLSNHQGKLSVDYFKSLKNKGVTCVVLRSSYTRLASPFRLRVDEAFENNIKNAHKAGIHVAIYHFSAALSKKEAKKEAKFCIKTIKPFRKYIDLPVALDCEFGETSDARFKAEQAEALGRDGMLEIIDAFNQVIHKAGFEPMLYANLSMFTHYLPTKIYKTVKIWVAQYNDKCEYPHPYYLWQYTSTNGTLDKNVFGSQDTKKDASTIQLPDRGYFKKGDAGDDVKELQKLINKKNKGAFDVLPKLTITGIYDNATMEHVELFQEARHMKDIDGHVGSETLPKLQTVKIETGNMIVNCAVAIARADKYAYGVGQRSHRYGDPFSGTNTGPVMKKKELSGEPHFVNDEGGEWSPKDGENHKHTYKNTMCCNIYVTVTYGYGGKIKSVKNALKKGSGFGTSPDTFVRYNGVKMIGKLKDLKVSDLKAGDAICISKSGKLKTSHAFVCCGGDWFAEAGSEGWGSKTIAHKKGLRERVEKYQKDDTAYVLRAI